MRERIHKTLEEVEAENEFAAMHDDLQTAYEEPSSGPEESADWEDDSASFDSLTDAAADLLAACEQDVAAAETPAPVRRRRRSRTKPPASGGSAPLALAGVSLAIGGFTLCAMLAVFGSVGSVGDNLIAFGLTPGLIVAMGILSLTTIGAVRRLQRTVREQIDWSAANDQTSEMLEYLVDAQEQSLERRPASGEELEQVLHSLARQDEKINNLTKALKMYGKPLVDVNRLATENGQKARHISTQIVELDQHVRSVAALEAKLDELSEALAGPRQAMQDVQDKVDGLDEKLLDSLSRSITEALAKVSREGTDVLLKAIEQISGQITGDVSNIMDTHAKDQDMQKILNTLRGELGQLKESVARSSTQSARQAPAPAPAASRPRPTQAPPKAAAAAPAASAAPAAQGHTNLPAGEGPATSISGTTKTAGKAVLGAIAKLKKMR